LFGKNYSAVRELTAAIKDRRISKYYLCPVASNNIIEKGLTKRVEAYLEKNERTNKVRIKSNSKVIDENSDFVVTSYTVIDTGTLDSAFNTAVNTALLKVNLITGKTHQIRSHMAHEGMPIIGDYKYGDKRINDYFKAKYGVKSQLLHSYLLEFNNMKDSLEYLSGKKFKAKPEKDMLRVLKDLGLEINNEPGRISTWERGTVEV